MFMFEQCRSSKWDLELFYNSPKPELSNCLRFWGFNLIPVAVFSIIFLFDLIVNRSLERKNKPIDYFKQYVFRFFIKFSLIISCCYELEISINYFINNDNELKELKLLSSIAKLNVYLLLLIFDISHHSKNMGTSGLLAFGVVVDFISKSYLIFEISYLHYTSYSLDELIIISIQFTCLLLLLISYVFIQNLPYSNDSLNYDFKKKPIHISDSINQNIHKQKGFSIKSRSLFSQISYAFYEPFLFFGYKNKYDLNNILPLEDELTVNRVLNDYEINYKNKYLKNSRYENFNILHLLSRLHSRFYLFNFTIFTIQIIITQLQPQIISKLITFISKQNDYKWHGAFLTVLLLICFTFKYSILAIFNRNMNYMQAKIQILLVNCIYRKSLKRSLLKDTESFDTYNLMTIDVNNILNTIYFGGDLIYFPINTGLSIYFIYQEMGIAFFYSFSVFLIVVPVTYFISQKTKRSQQRTMKCKDKRLKVLTDVLNGINTIKLNYWNSIFKEKIDGIRSEEMFNYKKYQIFYSTSQTIFHILPILLSVLTFFFYITIDDKNVLTPENAFTTLNYFNLFKNSFMMIPRFIHLAIVSTISAKRISKFLNSEEKNNYVSNEFNEENAVEIGKDVNFSWESSNVIKSNENALKNINIKIKKNNLVALISDKTASGRSSFISCLLGEMRLVKNEKNKNQIINISNDMKIALISNSPWIEKKSVKENILFGLPFNQAKYDYVLEQCLIREEIIKFKNGDGEIMDKDFDLEIKQKVSLARAFYSDANLILLDDFLNVFNDYSAKLIFDKIINPNKNSLFKNKTCIMVLNRLEYLRYFDQILIFNNGEIKSVDKDQYEFNDTNHTDDNIDYIGDMKKSHDTKTDLYKRSISTKLYNYNDSDISIQTDDHNDLNCINCSNKKLVHDENQTKIDFGAYKFYISTWKFYWLGGLIISHLLSIVFQIQVGQHLAYWSKHSDNRTGEALKQYNKDGLGKYVLLYFYNNVFYTLAALAAVFGEINSGIKIHKMLLNKVLSLQLYFFGKVPKGSIITRFSKDIDCIDSPLPFFFRASIFIFFQIVTVFYVLITTFPFSSILIAICTIIYFYLFIVFLRTLVAAKRLELQARTVLYNRFEELSSGLQTILAYNKTKLFTQILNQRLESDVNCNFMINISFKWLALRNEIISIIILIGTALFSILSDDVDAGKAGLVFNFGLTLLETLTGFIGLVAELHNNMVSVNRIRQYLDLEEEKDESNSTVPELWPHHGKIKFQNYSACYAECRSLVLENLDFKIKKYSLNSLVGGSSSGKSTFAYSLFNAIKPMNGTILIDGIDIHKISLKSLRQNLSIMVQESSLFTGTVRFNLDPEELYSDMEIWTVLDYIGLKDQILYLQGNLSYELTQGGSNLSLGQRQLLCLARAMLKKSKIMILDLISCQFDLETEIRLRKLFRTVFKDRTIILITKNLDQIMETDKILFLNNKRIQIFEKPEDIFNENNMDPNNNNENSNEVLDILNNNITDNILDIVNNNVE